MSGVWSISSVSRVLFRVFEIVCFQVTKRDDESSLMELKEEVRESIFTQFQYRPTRDSNNEIICHIRATAQTGNRIIVPIIFEAV